MEANPQVNPLIVLIGNYKEYQRIEEEAKEQKELLAAEIKTALGEQGVHRVGPYKITWQTLQRANVDTKRLKTEYPAIAELLTSSSSYERMTVN